MSKGWFVFSFIIFFCIALFTNQVVHHIPNMTTEILIIYYLINLVFYLIFAFIIYVYLKNRLFSSGKKKLIFSVFAVSFFLFPIVLQIATFIICLIDKNESDEGNKVKSFIANAISIIVLIYLFISYLYGGYKLIKDDSYSSKQMILGIVIPPYTIYIGISEMFSDGKKEDALGDKKSAEAKEFDSWLERKVN